jgi:aminoglycoside phosphotransferase (APT) family kinase protein
LTEAVAQQIHDHETDTSEDVVRSLLREQLPEWADAPLTYLETSGTDNAMWRIRGSEAKDLTVRLPRTPSAAQTVAKELLLLPKLRTILRLATPHVVHPGAPSKAFPHPWAVLEWLDGTDAWTARSTLVDPNSDELAVELASAVRSIRSLTNLDVPARKDGERGGSLDDLLRRLDLWLSDPRWNADGLIDVAAVRRNAAECAEVSTTDVDTAFVHGDLIPGNILVLETRLSAIIDWGGAGVGDPAQDLAPAWSIFGPRARAVFRAEACDDDAMWLRARAFELEHAVGGVLYYRPRGHPLADVMARTLERILTES